jgi:hypothetical protein
MDPEPYWYRAAPKCYKNQPYHHVLGEKCKTIKLNNNPTRFPQNGCWTGFLITFNAKEYEATWKLYNASSKKTKEKHQE